jgi:hypothetical protein
MGIIGGKAGNGWWDAFDGDDNAPPRRNREVTIDITSPVAPTAEDGARVLAAMEASRKEREAERDALRERTKDKTKPMTIPELMLAQNALSGQTLAHVQTIVAEVNQLDATVRRLKVEVLVLMVWALCASVALAYALGG